MMYEALSMLPRIWTEEVFAHEGKYYQVPPREVFPKPFQKPHPPLWSACNQEDTARMAGEQGLGFITHGRPGAERVGTLIASYKEAIKGAHPVGKSINDQVVVDTFCFCDENGAWARERGAEGAVAQMAENRASFARFWSGISEDSVPEEYKHHYRRFQTSSAQPGEMTPESLLQTGGYCIGDPDFCIEFIEQFEALGVDEYVLALQVGPITHDEVMNSLRLFGTYVIPHFQKKREETTVQKANATS